MRLFLVNSVEATHTLTHMPQATMSIRTLPLAFFAHCTYRRPIYFDVLPTDVLRVALFPFLDYESRIHINMLTPPGDRVEPRKIPKDRIIAHQLVVLKQHFQYRSYRAQLCKLEMIQKQGLAAETLNHLFDGHKILLYLHDAEVRRSLENTLIYYLENGGIEETFRAQYQDTMRVAFTKVRSFLEVNPLVKPINPKRLIWAWVTTSRWVYGARVVALPDGVGLIGISSEVVE